MSEDIDAGQDDFFLVLSDHAPDYLHLIAFLRSRTNIGPFVRRQSVSFIDVGAKVFQVVRPLLVGCIGIRRVFWGLLGFNVGETN